MLGNIKQRLIWRRARKLKHYVRHIDELTRYWDIVNYVRIWVDTYNLHAGKVTFMWQRVIECLLEICETYEIYDPFFFELRTFNLNFNWQKEYDETEVVDQLISFGEQCRQRSIDVVVEMCRKKILKIDHVLDYSKGKLNDWQNIVEACWLVNKNLLKTNRT